MVIERTVRGYDWKNYYWGETAKYAQSTIKKKTRNNNPYPSMPNLKDSGDMLAAFFVKLSIKPYKVKMYGMEITVDGAVLSYGFKGQKAKAMYDRYMYNALGFRGTSLVKPHDRTRNGKTHRVKFHLREVDRPPRDFLGMAIGEKLMREKRLISTIKTFIAIKNRR